MLSKALKQGYTPEQVLENLYLGTLSRYPDPDERRLGADAIKKAGSAMAGLQDVFWALLSSKEFLYNH